MRTTIRRTLATGAVVALATLTAGCGEEDFEPEVDVTDTASLEQADEVAVDSIVGLEVSAVGNVTEVLSPDAIRIDRDGLSEEPDDVALDLGDFYDYDYYDDEYLTAYDEEFGDDDLDEGVLVVGAAGGMDAQDVNDAVRVSGTIRLFDQDVLEDVYGVDLDYDELDLAGQTLVLVADSVVPADQAPDGTNGTAGDTGSTGSTDESTEDSNDG